MHTIGDRIKELRIKAGLSQQELAEKLYITSQAISKWENNSSQPDINLLPDLASIFGVRIDDLFEYSEDKALAQIENMIEIQYMMTSDEFTKAENFLLEKVKTDPNNHRVNSILGDLYISYAGNLKQKAVIYGKKALELKPDNIFDLNTVNNASNGSIYDFSVANHNKLIDYYKKELTLRPNSINIYEYLIKNLIDDGRYNEATKYLKKAKSLGDQSLYDFYSLFIKEKEDGFKEVYHAYLKLVDKNPDDWELLYNIANTFSLNGYYKEAIKLWRASFDCQPKPRFTDNYEAISLCYILMGEKDKAIETYKKEINLLSDEWGKTFGYEVDKIKDRINKLVD